VAADGKSAPPVVGDPPITVVPPRAIEAAIADSDSKHNLHGIITMLIAMAFFVGGDAMMKVMSSRLPTGETMLIRGIIATTLIWSLTIYTGAARNMWRHMSGLLALRTMADVGGAATFQSGLARLPFADAGAILQINPLVVTAGAAIFLGEKVGWRRWSATAIGLVGVLLIIRPGGSTFQWASLLMLAATLCAATRDLSTSRLGGAVPTLMITAFSTTAVTISSLAFSLFETWVRPSFEHIAMLAVPAICMLIGQFCVVVSIRSGEVSAVVPFRYSAILWTLLLSFLIWREVPDWQTLLGIAIVVSAGLYTFYREQVRRREALAAARTKAAERNA
jgi:drug/metabolite transporter (DMT)-like permease